MTTRSPAPRSAATSGTPSNPDAPVTMIAIRPPYDAAFPPAVTSRAIPDDPITAPAALTDP
ncbi:hypothetical protein GCM10023096_35020 [Nonomuraea ferruginea]